MSALFIGGTQSPLQRGFLRAAVVRRFTNGDALVRFDVHDVDTVGLSGGETMSVRLGTPRRGWHPLKFDTFLSPTLEEGAVVGSGDERLTVTSLRTDTPGFLESIEQELKRQTEAMGRFAEQCGCDVRHRGEELERAAVGEFAGRSTSWSDWCIHVGQRFIKELVGCELSTTSSYWSPTAAKFRPERFSVLDAFLGDERIRRHFGDITHRPGEHVPYFALFEDNGMIVREPLSVDHGTLRCGGTPLGLISQLNDTKKLLAALSAAAIRTVSLAPKAVPLYAQLRADGVLFGKDPAYRRQGEQLIMLIGRPVHPRLAVRFDLARAMGRKRWRPIARLLCNLGHAGKSGVVRMWQTEPSFIGLWLLGGDELVQATIATATVFSRGGRLERVMKGGTHEVSADCCTEPGRSEPAACAQRDSQDSR